MLTVLIIAISLSIDAFAVSISLSLKQTNLKKYILPFKCALTFGLFQFFMPLLGVYFSSFFAKFSVLKNYLPFGILSLIGLKMILETFDIGFDFGLKIDDKKNGKAINSLDFLLLGFATSIDAFFAGLILKNLTQNFLFSISIVGITTFVFSFFGAFFGTGFGKYFGKKAEILGGLALIFVAIKTLL